MIDIKYEKHLLKTLIFIFKTIEMKDKLKYVLVQADKRYLFDLFNKIEQEYNSKLIEEEKELYRDLLNVHKKFGNLIFSDSLISYICILNMYNYLVKNNLFSLNLENEFITLFEILDETQVKNDAKKVINLNEFSSENGANFRQPSKLMSSKTNCTYILDSNNTLWQVQNNGINLKRLFSGVKEIIIEDNIIIGTDFENKFWYYLIDYSSTDYASKVDKIYPKQLNKLNVFKIFKYYNNDYVLVVDGGESIAIRKDINENQLFYASDKLTIKNIKHISMKSDFALIIDEELKYYGRILKNLKSKKITKSLIEKNIVLLLTNENTVLLGIIGKVPKGEFETIPNEFTEVPIAEEIKDFLILQSEIIYITENGNIYSQNINSETLIKIATNIDYMCENKDCIFLVNNESIKKIEYIDGEIVVKTEEINFKLMKYIEYVKS